MCICTWVQKPETLGSQSCTYKQLVVSLHVTAGTWTGSSARAANALEHWFLGGLITISVAAVPVCILISTHNGILEIVIEVELGRITSMCCLFSNKVLQWEWWYKLWLISKASFPCACKRHPQVCLIIVIFILCAWVLLPECMYVYAMCACLVSPEARKGYQIPWN